MSGAQRATRLTPGSAYEAERANVDMAYRVFQLALEENVRRVVVASSNHAADWYEHLIHAGKMDMVTPETFPKSDNWYGWAKASYEHLGFVFATGTLGRQSRECPPAHRRAARDRRRPVRRRPQRIQARPRRVSERAGLAATGDQINRDGEHRGRARHPLADLLRHLRQHARLLEHRNARKVIGYAPEDDSEVKFAADIHRLLADNPGRT